MTHTEPEVPYDDIIALTNKIAYELRDIRLYEAWRGDDGNPAPENWTEAFSFLFEPTHKLSTILLPLSIESPALEEITKVIGCLYEELSTFRNIAVLEDMKLTAEAIEKLCETLERLTEEIFQNYYRSLVGLRIEISIASVRAGSAPEVKIEAPPQPVQRIVSTTQEMKIWENLRRQKGALSRDALFTAGLDHASNRGIQYVDRVFHFEYVDLLVDEGICDKSKGKVEVNNKYRDMTMEKVNEEWVKSR